MSSSRSRSSGCFACGRRLRVLAGASLVFFAYVGFDAVSTAAEEAKDPQRDLPTGIIASLIFCTVIYIIVSGLLTGIVPYTQLGVSSPVAHALQLLGYKWASALVSTGVIAGLTTVMLVLYYGLTRVVLAMSRDGLLPAGLATVHPRTQTPVKLILGSGVWIGLTLSGVAWIAMQLFSSRPAGDAMAVTIWGSASGWTLTALPLFVFSAVRSGEPEFIARGFGAAAVLMILVLILFMITRFLAREKVGKR